jgi:hypothetical protein
MESIGCFFLNPASDWFFFLASDWLIDQKWRLLISWLLIG